jgi:hypothetical protein
VEQWQGQADLGQALKIRFMTRPTRPTIFELDGVGRPFNFNVLANPTNCFLKLLNKKRENIHFFFYLLFNRGIGGGLDGVGRVIEK